MRYLKASEWFGINNYLFVLQNYVGVAYSRLGGENHKDVVKATSRYCI